MIAANAEDSCRQTNKTADIILVSAVQSILRGD